MTNKIVSLAEYKENKIVNNSGEYKASDLLTCNSKASFNITNHVKTISGKCISPINKKTNFGDFSDLDSLKPNIKRSVDYFKNIYEENKFNFSAIKLLKEHIYYINGGLMIGNIFWDLNYIFHSEYQKGKNELNMHGLNIPSIEDFEYSASLLPGKTETDKLNNLLGLLGIHLTENPKFRIWTSDSVKTSIGNLGITPVLKISISKILNRAERLISGNIKSMKILYLEGNYHDYYGEKMDKIYLMCGI